LKWTVDFYNERRRTVARYGVDAPTAAAAVISGRQLLVAQYPSTPRRGHPSLFEQAERLGAHDGTG
jgi:hypothetical protein